jgi:IclR family transcriptional regulator, KDG regulon repressor
LGKGIKTMHTDSAATVQDQEVPTGKSFFRAAKVLICISDGTNSITGIAQRCEMDKPSVHRLLKVLKESGFVSQDPISHKYFLGKIIMLLTANPVPVHDYLISAASDEMNSLSEVTKETISLGTMMGLKYVGVHSIQSKYDLRVVEEFKRIGELNVGAAGKVLLSQLNDKELDNALNIFQYDRTADGKFPTKEILKQQVKQIREQGFGISSGEYVYGATCISAPIKNYHLPVALSIIGPEGRLNRHSKDYIDHLLISASRISRQINQSVSAE